jgi:hypothetical protein
MVHYHTQRLLCRLGGKAVAIVEGGRNARVMTKRIPVVEDQADLHAILRPPHRLGGT